MKKILFILLATSSASVFAAQQVEAVCLDKLRSSREMGTVRVIDINASQGRFGKDVEFGLADVNQAQLRKTNQAVKSSVLCQAQKDGTYKLIPK